ncbi:hypothetical protein [Actinomadura sp. WAC 06369]|uniref:hypothetical protein n=1 Tax=Actinomadura sp. WAC 06369 TaxID=2203193 RepID=UPI000F76657C|nr:hypothetical protein [Actinomadura sp. WAC 06369]
MNITEIRAARRERRDARAEYDRYSNWLNTVLADLARTRHRETRAWLLETASDLTDALAEIHTAAWGAEDADGRPVAASLGTSAALLRQVAATERAVIAPPSWPAPLADYSVGERLWVDLAHTADPVLRALILRSLRDVLVDDLGETAVDVLHVVADTEHPRPQAPDDERAWFLLPRVVIAAGFTLIAGALVVPSPTPATAMLLLAAALTAIVGGEAAWDRFARPRLATRKDGADR